jgi:hypothetical protein
MKKPKSVDQYIKNAPEELRGRLKTHYAIAIYGTLYSNKYYLQKDLETGDYQNVVSPIVEG